MTTCSHKAKKKVLLNVTQKQGMEESGFIRIWAVEPELGLRISDFLLNNILPVAEATLLAFVPCPHFSQRVTML